MLARTFRLSDQKDVSRVYRFGRTVRNQHIVLKYMPNSKGHGRSAVVVSKKVAKSAVARNRIRRRVFEFIRLHPGQNFYDQIVTIHAADVANWPAKKLQAQLAEVFGKIENK